MSTIPSFSSYSLPSYNTGSTSLFQFPASTPAVKPYEYSVPSTEPSFLNQLWNLGKEVVINEITKQTTATTPVVARKTISFTVYDGNETLPGANISINGTGAAQTDAYGRVTLPNIASDAVIKVSYVGYDDYFNTSFSIPSKVFLKSGVTALNEVVIYGQKKPTLPTLTQNNSPAESSNWAMWAAIAAVGAAAIYKYSKSGTKIVRAKL